MAKKDLNAARDSGQGLPEIADAVLWQPLWPNFVLLTAVGAGQFEGNCLIPALFANARRQRDFATMISYSIVLVFGYLMLSAPIAVLAYGDAV
jgi:hypothetical protein